MREPTWQQVLGALTWRQVLLRRMQGHQDSLDAASTKENGLAGPHTLQMPGVQKARRPPRQTCRQALPVATASLPHSFQLLLLHFRSRKDLGGDLSGAMDERLSPVAVLGVVVGVCSWGTAAATLAVTRVAVAGPPLLIGAIIEARVYGAGDGVACLDAVDADDAAVARVALACARLGDGARSARAALPVLARRVKSADSVDVEASFGLFPSGGFGGNCGSYAATA